MIANQDVWPRSIVQQSLHRLGGVGMEQRSPVREASHSARVADLHMAAPPPGHALVLAQPEHFSSGAPVCVRHPDVVFEQTCRMSGCYKEKLASLCRILQ